MDSKLPEVGLTIFTEMTNLALQHGAINLSQGFPDFDTHPESEGARRQSTFVPAAISTPPCTGVAALRERIADKVRDLYRRRLRPGSRDHGHHRRHGGDLLLAVTAVVHPGDEVVIVEPAYDCYVPDRAPERRPARFTRS
ncbi:MAG: hypothetical protein MZV70_37840 [Desulfobacterales bacterium]|nr:hypothetical protein [Desulfobacterales bacterium]